jgi:catechol 2,3-dioxygenase
VGEIERLKMRFYAGSGGNHHDLALMQLPNPETAGKPGRFRLTRPSGPGLNHVAIRMPGEAALMRLFEHLKQHGYPVESRIDHGMSKSVYITDPDGNGIELMCDLPREVWEGDVNAALNHAEVLPIE